MKILCKPVYAIIECSRCKTIFKPENTDEMHFEYKSSFWIPDKTYTPCPTCAKLCEVTSIGVTKTNEES